LAAFFLPFFFPFAKGLGLWAFLAFETHHRGFLFFTFPGN